MRVIVFCLSACAIGVAAGVPRRASAQVVVLNRFIENEVSVELFLERDSSGGVWLVGVFTPLLDRFHLYGKDLPKNGVLGLGRPSLIELVSPGPIRPTGPLAADRSTKDLVVEPLGLPLQVYPEGSVNLRLPVTASAGGVTTQAELLITYAACSESTCLPPVIAKRISVTIPPSLIR